MEEKPKHRSRKKKPFPVKTVAAMCVVLAAAAGAGAGYYIHEGKQYETVFFPQTIINGMDASEKTVEQMEELILAGVEDYALTLVERGGETEQITGAEIGLRSEFDGSLEQYLALQNPMEWWSQKDKVTEYQIDTMIVYDDKLLQEKIDSLAMFDPRQVREPEDAYLSDYISGEGYKVLDGDPGNVADKEKVAAAIADAVANLKPELVIEELDAYKKSAVASDDPELNRQADSLNKYVTMKVTYEFGDTQEILDGDTIVGWIITDDDGQVSVSKDGVTAYVKELASAYNTAYQPKHLKTTYGDVVEITKGSYGWRINQEEEADQLYDILLSGVSQSREPVYSQTAASHGETDYGNTYVEINLTAQHLFFYKDGKLVIESDFVSGNERRGDSTPAGAYSLTYKQRNAVLRGATYASPVAFWMPFNGNIGMHDATWRGSFGGSIYKTNGSHGCVNLPPAVAMTIYDNIEKGMPVLCYHLPGTESKNTTTGRSYGTAPAPAVSASQLAPAVTPPVETAPVQVPGEETQSPAESETAGASETGNQETGNQGTENQGTGPVGPGVSSGNQGPGAPGAGSGSGGPAGPGGDSGNGGSAGPAPGGSEGAAQPEPSGGGSEPAGAGAGQPPQTPDAGQGGESGAGSGGAPAPGPGSDGGGQGAGASDVGPAGPGQDSGSGSAGPAGPGM